MKTLVTIAFPQPTIVFPFLWKSEVSGTTWLRDRVNGYSRDVALYSSGGHRVGETNGNPSCTDDWAWERRLPSGSTVTFTQE